MADDEREIDELYQLPLAEFTAARNALAKKPGASVAIKTLQKPSVPAWAVNQLYWRRRKVFDRVVAGAEGVRAAHAKMLAGKPADVRAAESEHEETIKTAIDAVREILREGGEAGSPATMTAVQETLHALPGDESPGRLTRPLKPKGFEALLGLSLSGVSRPAPVAKPPAGAKAEKPSPAAQKREAEAAKREAEARRREAAEVAEELREARRVERDAAKAAERAREAHEAAERERQELTERLDDVIDRLPKLADERRKLEKEAAKAVSERERLELRGSHLDLGKTPGRRST